jgi:hypothetical protein
MLEEAKMSKKKPPLFKPMVDISKLHEKFELVRTLPVQTSGRTLMEKVYQDFHDGDGNFVEQFQTTGFDQRTFELYLFAYFYTNGFRINQTHDRPDFLVERDSLEIAVEVTTVNASPNPDFLNVDGRHPTPDEIGLLQLQELPIRFGSPLFSKLKKQYWDLEHVADKPLVIAIQAFYDENALFFSSYAVVTYLYGLKQSPTFDDAGKLIVQSTPVVTHEVGSKRISSGFFDQPDSEHISAVIFTNSGTLPKFQRMGFQEGLHDGQTSMFLKGNFFNPDPNAAVPITYVYSLDDTPFRETWGQGLEVFYNPNALYPLPFDYFPDALQKHLENGVLVSYRPVDLPHPITSITHVWNSPKLLTRDVFPPKTLVRISRTTFKKYPQLEGSPIHEELEWYATADASLLGFVAIDLIDKDFAWAILKPDLSGKYVFVDGDTSLETVDIARTILADKMK